MTEFDWDAYELALSQERADRGLDLTRPVFDPREHPRNPHTGRFVRGEVRLFKGWARDVDTGREQQFERKDLEALELIEEESLDHRHRGYGDQVVVEDLAGKQHQVDAKSWFDAPKADDKPKVVAVRLKNELEAVASVELQRELSNWGNWNPEEEKKLADYLRSEMAGGTLSVAKGEEAGIPMGKIRAEGRRLLKRLAT